MNHPDTSMYTRMAHLKAIHS